MIEQAYQGDLCVPRPTAWFIKLLCATLCPLWFIPAVLNAANFPQIVNTQNPGEEPPTPQDAAAKITVPEDFKVTLFAGEPDVRQPIAFDFDDRGRLWVAEFYSFAGGPYDKKHRDRVIILHDTDQDGTFDEHKVFWDQGWVLTGLTWGFGGLWVLNNGTLSFIPDRNGDDVPDDEPQVMLDGWTLEAGHNVVNGLLWGPDGWLYGRHGIVNTSYPGTPDTPKSEREPINCGIWRFHPIRKIFEVVCNGTANPWGLDYDEHGQFFCTNNVTGHLWHVITGAHYRRMFGEDFNPHLYALIDQHADHYHWDATGRWTESRDGTANNLGGGHSHCGGMIYLGDNWPDEYRGSMFMCNTHGRRVNRDVLTRHGSGYIGDHADDFLLANQPWFRGVQLAYGPDGGVYLSDWTDNGECHDDDGVHRTSGRIYKIVHQQPHFPKGAPGHSSNPTETTDGSHVRKGGQAASRIQCPMPDNWNLAKLSSEDLVQLVTHKNAWFGRHARRLLQERAMDPATAKEIHPRLHHRLTLTADANDRLRLAWASYVTGGLDPESLLWMLDAPDPHGVHIRVWAIRLFCDQHAVTPVVIARFGELAESDKSALVRLTLASALQRLPLAERWPIAKSLAAHAEDANDHNLPLMIWYGIEPAVPYDTVHAIALLKSSQLPLIAEHIARRITVDLTSHPEPVDQLVRSLNDIDSPQRQTDILQGMAAALRGWRKAPMPAAWAEVQQRLLSSPDRNVRQATRQLAVVFGDGVALETLWKIAENQNESPPSRRRALTMLNGVRPENLMPLLLKLVGDRVTATTALSGLAAYDHPDVARRILESYHQFHDTAREGGINTLATRPGSALMLLREVREGRIPETDISAFQARQMASLKDQSVLQELADVWGIVGHTSAEKLRQINEWKSRLTPDRLEQADLSHGRLLYKKMCANCHRLYGQGSRIGPDLTGSNRHNLDYLLQNILDPSSTVPQQFTLSVVELTDGRIITGVIGNPTRPTVAIQTAKEQLIVRRNEIDIIRKTTHSLMPDGLLDQMSETDVLKLIAYLQSRGQVPLPKSTEVKE